MMKKTILLFILAVCMLLSGCGSEFAKGAKEGYNDDQRIAETEFSELTNVKTSESNAGCTFKASKLQGWTTVWKYSADEDKAVSANVSLSLEIGTAKVVHIDGSGKVTKLMEFESASSETVMGKGSADRLIKLTKGENTLKIVGFDCKDVEMAVVFK